MEPPIPRKRPATDPSVGLCADCRHAVRQPGKHGSVFWRCGRADRESGYLRYPPLPVQECVGFECR